MHCFDAPLRSYELRSDPIEQFGMRRRHAACAEVVRRLYQTLAEMVQPDAVRHHTGGERVLGRRDPVREVQPAAGGLIRDRSAAEDFEPPARHHVAELLGIAA